MPKKKKTATPKQGHLVLIDASGYLHRAFHAVPPLTRKDGSPIGAVSGFCNMLYKLMGELDKGTNFGGRPTHIALVLDAKGKTFRHRMYPDYKGNRPKTPKALTKQKAHLVAMGQAFGIRSASLHGVEADDLMASYCRMAREVGFKVTLITSDKDMLQVLEDTGFDIQIHDPQKSITSSGPGVAIDKFGVIPSLVPQVQALLGDSSDNVPGVAGVGKVTASALVNTRGGIGPILRYAQKVVKGRFEPDKLFTEKLSTKLWRSRKAVRLSLQLVTLETMCPLPVRFENLVFSPLNRERLVAWLDTMELKTLSRRVKAETPMRSMFG